MFEARIIKIELDPRTNFIRQTYEGGGTLAFKRYDIMDGGRDVWRPENLDMTQWKKVDEYTYVRIEQGS